MHGRRRRRTKSTHLLGLPVEKIKLKETKEIEPKINIPSLVEKFQPSFQTDSSIMIIPSSIGTSKDIKKILPIGASGRISGKYKPTKSLSISGGIHGSLINFPGKKTISNIGGGINLSKKFKKFSVFGGISGNKGGKASYTIGGSLNI